MTIAVTGHRDAVITKKLIKQVDTFFRKMVEKHTNITLLCALADGADQVVAKYALHYENISLEVPIPLSQIEYIKTLKDKESFFSLLEKAQDVFEVPKVYENPYQNLGHYLVNNSDVLVALWDGNYNAMKGGTGEVVSNAKSINRTIIHILTERQNT